MTIEELYSSVAQLGFETSLESNERFFYAANRALLQVNRIKPVTSIYRLNHFPLNNLIEGNHFEPVCKDKEALIYVAENARSYYFECNGNGSVIIEKNTDGETWTAIGDIRLSSSDGRFIEYKGLILDGAKPVEGMVRLRFDGDYLYYVQNVALYGSLLSNNAKDVPVYARHTAYDIASLTNDFMSFVRPPIADAARGTAFVLDQDYFIEEEGKILIPASVKGVFDICYNRRPRKITSAGMENNETIDLSEELCAILPNLVASYIWVDDEPDKAQYYLSLYREQVAEIAAKQKDMRPFVYRNKTGW
jgi:hypothetical protein